MKYSHFKTSIMVAGLVLAAVLMMTPLDALSQGGAELICEPNRGTYGLQIFLKGNGFAPSSQIQIEAFHQTIAPQSDSTGQFMVIAYAPTDEAKFQPGDYTLIAKDATGASAEAIFVLEALQPVTRPAQPAGPTSSATQAIQPPPTRPASSPHCDPVDFGRCDGGPGRAGGAGEGFPLSRLW